MKLLITRPVSAGLAGSFAAGQVVDLPDAIAAELLAVGKARAYVAPAFPAAPVAEVAAVAPVVETAAIAPIVSRKRTAKK